VGNRGLQKDENLSSVITPYQTIEKKRTRHGGTACGLKRGGVREQGKRRDTRKGGSFRIELEGAPLAEEGLLVAWGG